MKKRIMSLLLAMALALGLAAPAWAENKYMVTEMPDASLVLSVGQEAEAARRLNALGLFQGVGTNADGTPDFDLDRTPTRVEGVVMLVRLLGKDKEGQKGGWKSPFTDVPTWASSYVGYAYNNQYTKGTSDTAFSPMVSLDAAQYLTLVLRAMDYKDGEDFQWDSPWTLSNALGITDYDPANPGSFTRGTAALWAWNALSALTADITGSKSLSRLADQLMARNAFTAQQGLDSGLFSGKGGIALSCGYCVMDVLSSSSGELTVRGLPENSPDLGFVWTSSNPDVVSVKPYTNWSTGVDVPNTVKLSKGSAGQTVITATSPDGAMSASCVIRVVDTRISLNIEDSSGEYLSRGQVWVNDTVEFTARVTPENSEADKEMTWAVLDRQGGSPVGADVASLKVVSSDTVRGISTVQLTMYQSGTFYLSCRTKDTSTGLILNVNEASPDVIIDCNDTVPAGEWMYAEVKPVKTYDPNLRVLLWENSNPEVAKLSAATDFTSGRMAILDGLKPGTTTISATLNNGTTVSRTITVTDALAEPVINLPQFPCTVELRNASGVQLYQLTITEGRYDLDDGLWLYLKGTVDAASSSAANIMLNFRITDDATGEVVEQDILVLPGQTGPFTYTPSGYSPDAYGPFRKGHSYTITFQ